MKTRRWAYRAKQFWFALHAAPTPEGLSKANTILTAEQLALFNRLQPSEQAHALEVLQKILQTAPTAPPELLTAALLHDVGKARHPLRLAERVLIVLGQAFFKAQAEEWGKRTPKRWARPFVVAAQHPAWGAEMAARAGTAPLACALIQRHQDPCSEPISKEDHLLVQLQAADDDS